MNVLVIPHAATGGGLGWSQKVPLGCKVTSSTAKEKDTKMTRARVLKLFRAPFLQPDSCSRLSSDCPSHTKSFQSNLRQCLPSEPWDSMEVSKVTWKGPTQNGQQRVTPAHCHWVPPTKNALLISRFQELGYHLALGYLYLEKRLKEINALAKISLPSAPLEMPSGKQRRRIPHLARSWENGATSSGCRRCPVSSPSPQHRSRPAFHRPPPPVCFVPPPAPSNFSE